MNQTSHLSRPRTRTRLVNQLDRNVTPFLQKPSEPFQTLRDRRSSPKQASKLKKMGNTRPSDHRTSWRGKTAMSRRSAFSHFVLADLSASITSAPRHTPFWLTAMAVILASDGLRWHGMADFLPPFLDGYRGLNINTQ